MLHAVEAINEYYLGFEGPMDFPALSGGSSLDENLRELKRSSFARETWWYKQQVHVHRQVQKLQQADGAVLSLSM